MSKTEPKKRAMSLSTAWENIVKDEKFKHMIDELHDGFEQFEKPPYSFVTGSTYTGNWDAIGMAGFGTYVFPHRVEYEGTLRDGMYHGKGTLTYPKGQKLDGIWVNGVLKSWTYRFPDGLEYEQPWEYCQNPDRRFHTSIEEGLRPAAKELRTNESPPRTIPDGCYDTGDGFYDPKSKCVVSALNHTKIIRIPTASEEQWIVNNCRKAWDEPTNYQPELYPQWFSGRARDLLMEEEITDPMTIKYRKIYQAMPKS